LTLKVEGEARSYGIDKIKKFKSIQTPNDTYTVEASSKGNIKTVEITSKNLQEKQQ